MTDHRIELVPLSMLATWGDPRNEKSHDLEEIKASIRRHGFTVPALVDERTGMFGAGHGRVDALVEMHDACEDPPRRIDLDPETGEWLVPVLRGGFDSADDLEATAYRVGDNQTTIVGGWDAERLADVLSELGAADAWEGTGFRQPDLDRILADLAPAPEPEGAPDQSERLITRRSVLVDVADDASQRDLIDRLTKEGMKCRALNS